MTIQETIEKVRSGVCKIEFYLDGKLTGSGSGFVYKNKLITNSHIFHNEGNIYPGNTGIIFIFGDGEKAKTTIGDLKLCTGSDDKNADFAVYDMPGTSDRFNFELSDIKGVREGDEVLLFGFPFGDQHLTTHYGRISAIFESHGIRKIQVDASVNQGNSGGPLYHLATGKVIGIVTRKESGLTKDFDDLLVSFSGNIKILKDVQKRGNFEMFGLDLVQMFEVPQSQMQTISRNIKRSANTGIGYAFSCEKLLKESI